MSKKDASFLHLSERETTVAIILFFAIGFVLFFAGYLWGSHSSNHRLEKDFSSELRRSLVAYTGGSVDVASDDPLVEDFDIDNEGERSTEDIQEAHG